MSGGYRVYKLTLRPKSSFRTPLQSDTIFGHLMWALRYTEGEEALRAFLGRYRPDAAPLLVSAAFPAGHLPVPVLPNREGVASNAASDAGRLVGAMVREALEAEGYLPLAQWHELAERVSASHLAQLLGEARGPLRALRQASCETSVVHTAVDRITGSAREGQLYVSEETFYEPGWAFEVWHKVDAEDEALVERVDAWWHWVEMNGFGRRKSAGRGAFEIDGSGLVGAAGELPQVSAANGFVSLSAWVPAHGDPLSASYRTRVKRGKLAEALAVPHPWKKPLLMLVPGTVAPLPDGAEAKEWYGRVVEQVHWTKDEVVQYGLAFPLPVRVEGWS